uniref:Ysc84 actin-binding domain-containing protein n=1 Tax=Solibacter usitatus (strain Ellin6076) TaxID=234267 RepID=Q01SA9_SOLUE
MRKFALALALSSSAMLLAADTAAERMSDATKVFDEIMSTPDKGIPQDLLEKAHCIVIVPGMKQAAFVVGGKFGKGFVDCRQTGGGWGAPAAVRVEGGSFGFQIGGSSTDVVMLVMNERGMRRLLEDKFTLGGEATVAAGPVGRSTAANTDAQMSAEILSWSRSKGLFAGVALQGATLRPDEDTNKELYGSKLTNKEILTGDVKPPAAAHSLTAALSRYSFRESKDTPIENRATDADRKKK